MVHRHPRRPLRTRQRRTRRTPTTDPRRNDISGAEATAILEADGWPALQAQLRRLENHDHDLADILTTAYEMRSMGDAVDPADVAFPWANDLRTHLIPDNLIETIATWRTLHAIDDETTPLGPEPASGRTAPDHHTWLTGQLASAQNDVTRQKKTHLERLLAGDHPTWAAWLGQPPPR